MLILTLRTDKPEAELALFEDEVELAATTWLAHRELAETIHQRLLELLQTVDKQLSNVQGIILYKGPGSFTGLRIGAAVANALSASLQAMIVGQSGQNWQQIGRQRLAQGKTEVVAVPDYGAEPNITVQKH